MKLLEACVDSLASARAAIRGGADRLELCSALMVGGLTPYIHLLEQIREESAIPIRCLIRCRPGDFLYEKEEIDLMVRQIKALKAAGSDGFAIGCLEPVGWVDKEAMLPLVEAADGAGLTLHRCIDVSLSYSDGLLTASELGIDTVLTSACGVNCLQYPDILETMLQFRDELHCPEIMVGAGVNADVIRTLREMFPTLNAFHMSGKVNIPSKMEHRDQEVHMGVPGLDEWSIPTTSEDAIRAARIALDS